MARSIVLGNGNTLVCLDRYGQVRDFYYPYVGLENHIARDFVHKVGIWSEGKISWLDDGSWTTVSSYEGESMVGHVVATNQSFEIKLTFLDIVYNEKNIFVRRVLVENLSGRIRQIKVFFNQQFQIGGNTHADTAYYNPAAEAIIHYKGRHVFLVGGLMNGRAFDEWSVGLFRIEGKDGVWRDAEDGSLSKNPIEHGSVDSAIGFSMELTATSAEEFYYFICAGETYREVQALLRYVLVKTPAHLIETTKNFWHTWVNKIRYSFIGLSDDVIRLYKNSLLVIRAHSDNRGGILASGDSDNFQYGRDTYGYIWPRDAAFIACALDKAGYSDISERFYLFVNKLVTDEGYLLHKYQPDKSLGSSWHPWVKDGRNQLAIQEDETATVIFMLWEHYKIAKDLEFIESIYNSLIKRCAEFLVSYRDIVTDLPAPSYDLWEEKYGVSTYTTASVYGALIAASYFASLLGKDDDRVRFSNVAGEMKVALQKHMYNTDSGYFHKLTVEKDGIVTPDTTCDFSSFFGLYKFGVIPGDDAVLKRAFAVTYEKLICKDVGGIVRYDGDKYFASESNTHGNPWFITTLWALQYKIDCAEGESDLKDIARELSAIASRAVSGAMLSEQFSPVTGEQLSVSPLAWSQAEYVFTVIAYMEKIEKLGLGAMCYPVE